MHPVNVHCLFFSLEASKYPKIPGLEISKYPKIPGLKVSKYTEIHGLEDSKYTKIPGLEASKSRWEKSSKNKWSDLQLELSKYYI